MNKKIVLAVTLVVMIATVFPVAGLLPMKAGIAKQAKQTELGDSGSSGSNDIWPMFRHDAGNTGCSQFFAPNTNHVMWKKQINSDVVQTTPILYGDKLYISTGGFFKGPPKTMNPLNIIPPSPSEILQEFHSQQSDASTGLYCLDAKTGAQLWFRSMYGPTDPAIVNDKIYVVDMDINTYYSILYCLDAATGDIIFQKSLNSMVLSPTIVANDKIYLGCFDFNSYYGSLKCYDLSGNLVWNHPLAAYEALWFSAPAISGGNVFFITSNIYSYYSGKLYCLNAVNGQTRWSHPVFSLGYFYASTPSAVCADNNVYVTDFDMNTYEGTLICYDGATGSSEWACYLGDVLSIASPAISQDSVYVTAMSLSSYTSWLYRIELKNGTYLWRVPLPQLSYFGFGSPICSADKIIVTPGMYGDYSSEIYCFEREDGLLDWKFTTDSFIYGGPSIGDGLVYVADSVGNVYAFEDVLKIQSVHGGLFGVNAAFQNTGNATLSNISWTISVFGGAMGMINRTRSGTIQELPAGKSKTVRLIPLIGLGSVEITVNASMSDMSTLRQVRHGMMFGTVCLITP